MDQVVDELKREFVDTFDQENTRSLDELAEQCIKVSRNKRKIAEMGAAFHKKARMIREN